MQLIFAGRFLALLDYYDIPTESVKVYFRRDYALMNVADAKPEEY